MLEAAAADADLMQECAPEQEEIKCELFQQLEHVVIPRGVTFRR